MPRLAEECRRWISPKTELATLEFQEPSLYWYLRPKGGPWIQQLKDEAAARQFLARPGSRLCVLPDGESFGHLSARFPELRTIRVWGFNPANGTGIELRALIRETP